MVEETADRESQSAVSKAASHSSDIPQDAHNRQHGDSAYQRVSPHPFVCTFSLLFKHIEYIFFLLASTGESLATIRYWQTNECNH